jgi:hypothetical protein
MAENIAKTVPPDTVGKLRKMLAFLDDTQDPEELRALPAENCARKCAGRIRRAVKVSTRVEKEARHGVISVIPAIKGIQRFFLGVRSLRRLCQLKNSAIALVPANAVPKRLPFLFKKCPAAGVVPSSSSNRMRIFSESPAKTAPLAAHAASPFDTQSATGDETPIQFPPRRLRLSAQAL